VTYTGHPVLIKSMEQSPPWEANSRSVGREIPCCTELNSSRTQYPVSGHFPDHLVLWG